MVDSNLEKKCFAACQATIRQPFFDTNLPSCTLRALYRKNVRSILMYGLILTTDISEVEKLDRKLINCFIKPLTKHKRALSDRLTDIFCLRIRLPSLAMDLACSIKNWTQRLRRCVNFGLNRKVREHARDTLKSIQKLDEDTMLRKHFTRHGGAKEKILLKAFQEWNHTLSPAKKSSRAVDIVSKITIDNDVLDSCNLTAAEKCSGYCYLVYRFPTHAKLSKPEQSSLRLILKQDLSRAERAEVIQTLRATHS